MMGHRTTRITSTLAAAIGAIAALSAIAIGSTAAIAQASAVPAAHARQEARAPARPGTISESLTPAGQGQVAAGAAAHKPGKGAMRLRPVRIPLASLSPALRTSFTRNGQAPATVTAYEITSLLPGNFCLDANDYGPTAGQTVTKSSYGPVPGTRISCGSRFSGSKAAALTTLVSDHYQTECLNANSYPSGLHNGSNTQLYTCSPSYYGQELWNFGNLQSYVQSGFSDVYLFLGTTNFVLAAATYPASDGDVVQIGIPSTAGSSWTAQLWN